jgi:integrase
MLTTAFHTGDFSSLDLPTRELAVRLHRNKGWKLPPGLVLTEEIKPELTLWDAIMLRLKEPGVKDSSIRERHEQALAHVVEKFGKDFLVEQIWMRQIIDYMQKRVDEGAAASTVNKEKAALSWVFQGLLERRHLEVNPTRLVKNLSEKLGQRQAYIGAADFRSILENMPPRFRAVVQTAYFTGMRRGEIRKLKRHQVRLAQRMIILGPADTKEGNWKRVPIHEKLIPVLEEVMKVRVIGRDEVFLVDGVPLAKGTGRRAWEHAVEAVGLDPAPHFHDLRHTWKTNALGSGIDPEIREAILGHWFKAKSVTERYGRIGDQTLIRAIDLLTFDHGPSEIFVAGPKKEEPRKRVLPRPGKDINRTLTGGPTPEKEQPLTM